MFGGREVAPRGVPEGSGKRKGRRCGPGAPAPEPPDPRGGSPEGTGVFFQRPRPPGADLCKVAVPSDGDAFGAQRKQLIQKLLCSSAPRRPALLSGRVGGRVRKSEQAPARAVWKVIHVT